MADAELKTVPTGRVLAASAPKPRRTVALKRENGSRNACAEHDDADVTFTNPGPAEAQISDLSNGKVIVSIDFQNTVPEIDETNAKAKVGPTRSKASRVRKNSNRRSTCP